MTPKARYFMNQKRIPAQFYNSQWAENLCEIGSKIHAWADKTDSQPSDLDELPESDFSDYLANLEDSEARPARDKIQW